MRRTQTVDHLASETFKLHPTHLTVAPRVVVRVPHGLRYHLDPDTGQPHMSGHGVTLAEAEYVLRHPGDDRPGRDDSRHALGQTAAGRYLRVIYVPDEIGDGVFVVTAYDLRGKPLQRTVGGSDDE